MRPGLPSRPMVSKLQSRKFSFWLLNITFLTTNYCIRAGPSLFLCPFLLFCVVNCRSTIRENVDTIHIYVPHTVGFLGFKVWSGLPFCDPHKQDVSCPRPKCSAGCTHTPFVFNQLSHACLRSSKPSYLLSEELEQLR